MNTDYTNSMPITYIPTPLKLLFFLLIGLNMYYYKKLKIARNLEEHFPSFIKSFASLSFLLLTAFIFATYDKDIYLEIFSIVLGIGICLSYMSSIYEDAEDKKIGKKWLVFGLIVIIDSILFIIIPNKIIAYALILLQNLIFMLVESKKRTGNNPMSLS